MALFPAFAGAAKSGEKPEGESPQRELNWLTNPSFSTEDALRLHQHALDVTDPDTKKSSVQSTASQIEPPGETEACESFEKSAKKRKKKKKREHKKVKKRKRSRDHSTSDSELDSEDVRNDRNNEKGGAELKLGDESSSVNCNSIWLDDVQGLRTELFRTDKKPDPANWQYKSLYRGNIARYKRRSNFCLGIDLKRQYIIWESSAGEKKPSHKRSERYFTKGGRKLLNMDGIPITGKNQDSPPGSTTWIPILHTDTDDTPTTSYVNPLGIYDPLTTLWLQGKGPPEHDSLKHQETQERSESGTSHLMTKMEEYNRKVRENPRDVKAWMDFVSFQDELMNAPSCFTMSEGEWQMKKKSLKLVLEKKLAILERAVENNPNSVDLKLAKLKLCMEFWEPSAVMKEWQKLVFLHPNDPVLWQKYLLFCQSQFSTFVVSKVHSLYGKCLSTLSAVQDGSMVSHPALPGTEEAMLAIFLQQCHFLRQAGHSEKAVSLFQALIDFTFFKPDSVKDLPTRGQVEFFEPFWDSGEPRIGEKGAKGWKAWMHQQEKGGWVILNPPDEDEEDVEEEEEIKNKSLPKWQNWLHVERSREAKHWLPWRPDKTKKQTVDDCEDPERQVLFDDLGPSLIKVSSPDLQFQLICSFLQFLGVPCSCSLLSSFLYLALDEKSIFDDGQHSQGPLTSFDLPLFGISCIGHMDPLVQGGSHVGHLKEGEEFIQNFFHRMLPLFSGKEKSDLSVFWLQYEISKVIQCLKIRNKKKLKLQSKKSKKLAKNLLKAPDNRNNVSLWQMYAHLEWLLGNVEEARKVFDMSLSMAGATGLRNLQVCKLGLLYAELETELLGVLEGTLECRAVHILMNLAEKSPYVPYSGQVLSVNILKARKTYQHLLQDYLSEGFIFDQEQTSSSSHLVGVVGCYSLFQYLTLGIDSAVSVYREVYEKLKGKKFDEGLGSQNFSLALEAVTRMHASLLRYHMKNSVYPLNPLREALLEALKMYPSNQSLWRAYIQIQSKSHNASKARRFFDSITRTTKSLEPWLFAVQAEQMRKKLIDSVQRGANGDIYATIPETGLTNRIKALFEHAVETENGAHCPLLWRLYIVFMVSLGDKEKSKGLFYRALQNCPWTKVLYMDAIEYFPDELQEILDLMAEKELRVRVPVEELELLLED
ncbi:nuclear exosome regulator NRDE2 isoform X2 [Sceloporus undulatus]|uniref:nuclear exosome regulator NRDE2 isoform X2 n=1 Tax=Sceloporus undulatus TaxID=8520 RepID=UPI001C4B66FC|nr:nuclear exosome regulator NRDE2 isoform X2 [Sceloporus undulatus]